MSKRHVGKHQAQCSVCQHPKLHDIEREVVDAIPQTEIADKYGLSDAAISRHLSYFPKLKEQRSDGFVELIGEIATSELARLHRAGKITAKDAKGLADLYMKASGRLVHKTQEIPAEIENKSEPEVRFWGAFNRWPDEAETQEYKALYDGLGYWPSRGEFERAQAGDIQDSGSQDDTDTGAEEAVH